MYSKLLSMLQLPCLKDACFAVESKQFITDSFENDQGYMFCLSEIWAPRGFFLLLGAYE